MCHFWYLPGYSFIHHLSDNALCPAGLDQLSLRKCPTKGRQERMAEFEILWLWKPPEMTSERPTTKFKEWVQRRMRLTSCFSHNAGSCALGAPCCWLTDRPFRRAQGSFLGGWRGIGPSLYYIQYMSLSSWLGTTKVGRQRCCPPLNCSSSFSRSSPWPFVLVIGLCLYRWAPLGCYQSCSIFFVSWHQQLKAGQRDFRW